MKFADGTPIPMDHELTWLSGSGTKSIQLRDLTPAKAFRAKCLDCCAGSPSEVDKCAIVKCPLYPYRFGKTRRGGNKRVLTPEQKKAMLERLAEGRRRHKIKSGAAEPSKLQ